MSRFGRFFLIAVVFAAALAMISGMLLAYALTHSRMVRVELREHTRCRTGALELEVPVPARLLAASIAAAAFTHIQEGCQHRSQAAVHGWRPAARAPCRALVAAPDGVLAVVEGGPGKVTVVKHGDTVEVHVQGPEGDAKVTTPAGLVWHLTDLV